jgi:probable phosphoglycerate mutase
VTAAPPALPVGKLLLWRHGRTEWNATGRFQGHLDPPLDDEGRRQASLVASLLADGLHEDGSVVVVSSDLRRAADTAQALTALIGAPLRTDPRLREHGLGCWEGLTRDEVADQYPDQFADWLAGRPVQGRGGEEPAAVAARAVAALAELPEAELAVVVTHGGTAGRLLEQLLQLGPEHRRIFGPLANGAWSELAFHATRWRLIRHNSPVPDGRPAPTAPAGAEGGVTPEGGATPEEGPPQDADAV